MSYHIHENEQTTPQNLLSSEPVCVLKGDEFLPKDGITFIQQVEDFFRKQGGLAHSAFGDVILDKKGIKNDFHHGMSPIKRASFAAIKDVLEKGSIILPLSYYHTNDKKQLTGMVAAPIIIDNERYVCVVEVIANVSTQRLYVHESFLSKTLQDIVATSPVHNSTNTASRQHQGEIAKVLQNYLTSKELSVKNTENNNKTNENRNMNKKQIRLTESELKHLIRESVKRVLNESYQDKEYTQLLSQHGGYDRNNPYYYGSGNIFSDMTYDDIEIVAPNEDFAKGYLWAKYGKTFDFGNDGKDISNISYNINDLLFDTCSKLSDGSILIFKNIPESNGGDMGKSQNHMDKQREREKNVYDYDNEYTPVMNSKNHMSDNNDDFYFTRNKDYAEKMRKTIYK